LALISSKVSLAKETDIRHQQDNKNILVNVFMLTPPRLLFNFLFFNTK